MRRAPAGLLSLFIEPRAAVSEGPAHVPFTQLSQWRTWVNNNVSGDVAQSRIIQLLYIVYTRSTAIELNHCVDVGMN